MKLSKSVLLVIILISLFLPSYSANADMAPPPAPGLGGLRPFQYQSTEVQMVYERVEMTLNPLPEQDDYLVEEKVDVSAWFVMHNTSSDDEKMKAAFPLSSLLTPCNDDGTAPRSFGTSSAYVIPGSFRVSRDGMELPTQVAEIEGIDCVSWAIFDIDFPAQKDVLVKVDYSLRTEGSGHDLILEYILETGAGWKGPIKQAYIVFRFPYLATNGNVDAMHTTPGYQSLYNEIFWSYRDIEPTPNDNIIVSFFEPRAWMRIGELQMQVADDPTNIEAWLKLFDQYQLGAPYNTTEVVASFERATKFNPDNAELYAKYAEYLLPYCCYYLERGSNTLPPGAREFANHRVIPLINSSLELDPHNETALDILASVQYVFPDLTYTPPPPIPSTATSLFTSTPSVTPSPTITPLPSEIPAMITVVHTKIVKELPLTSTPKPATANTIETTMTNDQKDAETASSMPVTIVGMIATLIVGFVIGNVWSKWADGQSMK